jgi:hypothetical protein
MDGNALPRSMTDTCRPVKAPTVLFTEQEKKKKKKSTLKSNDFTQMSRGHLKNSF